MAPKVPSLMIVVMLALTCCMPTQRASGARPCCEAPENEACRANATLTTATIEALGAQVRLGDKRSIDIAFSSRGLLDGGELEDLDRELAALAVSFPREFLEGARMHCLADLQMTRLVTMLPLETVDDVPRQEAILNERINRLSGVDNPELRSGRDKAVEALRAALKALEGH